MKKPIEFVTKHRPHFSQLDPYGHLNSEQYMNLYLANRFEGLREKLGWSFKEFMKLPVAFYVKCSKIEYIRPVVGDEEVIIRSQISEFKDVDCEVEFTMQLPNGKLASKCSMNLVCIDAKTKLPIRWPSEIKDKFFVNETKKSTDKDQPNEVVI